MFPIRRTFLLIVTFDAIFMGLLWIIYNQVGLIVFTDLIRSCVLHLIQILNITIDEAFQTEVLHYTIKTSLFDVVVSHPLHEQKSFDQLCLLGIVWRTFYFIDDSLCTLEMVPLDLRSCK